MSPRHFYRASFPKAAANDDAGLHNAFVAFTHMIGLKRFFSFIPLPYQDNLYFPDFGLNNNPVKDPAGEKAGDQTIPDTNPL